MGVHTGEADVRQDDYVGLDVHRAARICAAGHGGQVLISSSTRELVADELPADVALRDLGEHRLKDLDHPEHLFQLVVGDLPADFPPLASLSPGSGGANGLPPSPNRTIGRARRRAGDRGPPARRRRAAADPHGPGRRRQDAPGAGGGARGEGGLRGRGAPRLARRVAQAARTCPPRSSKRWRSSSSRASLPSRPPSASSPPSACCWWWTTSSTCWRPRRSSAGCWGPVPSLTVLATSREPLGLQAEERYPVASLALPARATPEDAEALARVRRRRAVLRASARPRPRLRPR